MASEYRPRFDRSARYGAAIVAMLLGTYLLISTSFGAIIESEDYVGTIRTDIPLLNVFQFIVILAALVAAVVMLPGSLGRRIGAVTLVCVVLLNWATLGLLRGAGVIAGAHGFWAFVLDQGFVTLIVAVGGWVIARGRHPLTWLVVLVALVPPVVARTLTDLEVDSGIYAMVIEAIVIVGGLAAVWLAAWGDRLLRGRAEARG